MQNLFIINRFEFIEPEKSIDSITYNNDQIFDSFVRVFHDEEIIPNETHPEQWARIGSALSEIENIRKKFTSMNMQRVWWTCDMFDESLMRRGQTIDLKPNKKSFHSFIYFLSKDG